jgi:serine/threonine protein kinase
MYTENNASSGYRAPELWEGRGYGGSPDMYSAGVMLGEALLPHDKMTRYMHNVLGQEDMIGGFGVYYLKEELEKNPRSGLIRDALELFVKLIAFDPKSRPSAKAARAHPFIVKSIAKWRKQP